MTNYEKVKNMSIKEMAELFAFGRFGPCAVVSMEVCNGCPDCSICFRKWLEREAEQ